MAFKTFVAGDVLTAAEVNTYLAKQAVIVCTAGTRPSAPVEGMVIYETDTDDIFVYNAANWVRVHPSEVATRVNGAALTTSAAAESTIATISVPAQNFPYRVKVAATVFRTQTVAGDSFGLAIKNGAAITAVARGTGAVETLRVEDHVDVSGGGALTITVVLYRASGTGTASTFADGTSNFVRWTIEAL